MDYLVLLCNQFNKTKGYKKTHLESKGYINELAFWLYDLKKQSDEYFEFGLFNGINLANGDFIEINKGRFDTLRKGENIISPFASTLNLVSKDLVVYQGEPLIIDGSKIKKGQVVDTYCTHNPYNKYYFGNLDELHNNGYMICFGMFGKNRDKDKQSKVEFVKDVAENMGNDFIFEYETDNENFYCMVFLL